MNRIISAFTDPEFIESLKVMGKGMLAIFIVMACIMLTVFIFNKLSSLSAKSEK